MIRQAWLQNVGRGAVDWGEFFTLCKANPDVLKLKKNRHAYLVAFESISGVKLGVESDSTNPFKKEGLSTGGQEGRRRRMCAMAFSRRFC